jgi:1,3-beta-glucan synthase
VLYFTLLIVFVALIVGPAVGGKMIINTSLVNNLNKSLPFPLLQPDNWKDRDNTRGRNETGTGSPGYTGPGTASRTESTAQSTDSTDSNKFRFL